MRRLRKFLPLVIAFFPGVALAAPATFQALVLRAVYIMDLVVPVLVTVAFVIYLYGIAQSISAMGDAKKRTEKLKGFYFNGLVILFVMVSIWGILAILKNTLYVAGTTSGPTQVVNTNCSFGTCN